MMRVYSCLIVEHDPKFLFLAVSLCLLSAMTSLTLIQRASLAAAPKRLWWLLAAGMVTGLSIWITHFSAMLAYRPGVEVRFDAMTAIGSVIVACGVATAAWMISVRETVRWPLVGGTLIAIALSLAHFIDMAALRVAGFIHYESVYIAASITGGLILCSASVYSLRRSGSIRLPIIPTLLLGSGVLFLHFVAMSAVSIVPASVPLELGLTLSMNEVSVAVIAAAIVVFCVGLAVAYYDRRLADLTARDAGQMKELVSALKQSEEHHRFSVELNPQIPWTAEADGKVSEAGPRWAEVVGSSTSSALGDGWMRWLHPDDFLRVKEIWNDVVALNGESHLDIRYRLKQRDGSYRWFRARARARRDESGSVIKWYGSLEDVHEQVVAEAALRESEERYRLASRATQDIIWDWSHETNRVQWSDAIETVLGYPHAKDGTDLQWWLDLIHPADRRRFRARARAISKSGSPQWTAEYRVRAADGSYRHMLSRGHLLRASEGKPIRSVGALLDITQIKLVEENLRWGAHHDPLTGLPNRALFAERMDTAFAEAGQAQQCVGLVTLDVDRFKSLNDSMGHGAGDILLKAIAERLLVSAPSKATVARLGGDEFAVILPGLNSGDARIEVVEELLADMAAPLSINGRSITPSLSAGAAMWPMDAADAEGLLKCADLALYAAKNSGRGAIRGFKPEMRLEVEQQTKALSEARSALKEDRVVPFYQPKICLRTGLVIGFEALLRWHHPRRGLMPPSEISAAFEDAEISVMLTQRMLTAVFGDLGTWLEKGIDPGRIAINGSAADFVRDDFADRILSALHAARVKPERLELEVTETVFLGRSAAKVERALNTLSMSGVTIALDDFGTGYASLTHLQQFPVNTLKIDRSFISRLPSKEDDAVIVEAVIDLAHRLRMTTVAEGIEEESQVRQLTEIGCDAGQGYLFGRPMEASRVEVYLTSVNSASRPLVLIAK